MRITKYLLHNLFRSLSSFLRDGDTSRMYRGISTTGREKKKEKCTGLKRAFVSRCDVYVVVAFVHARHARTHRRARARPRASRSTSTVAATPPYSTYLRVRIQRVLAHVNGALLHTQRPPTARMHVSTHTRFYLPSYSRIFSSQWL